MSMYVFVPREKLKSFTAYLDTKGLRETIIPIRSEDKHIIYKRR